tara:strand:- start:82 stop:948 length:867 start_codon:yes stop_codon:yes gene_type:complete
VDAHPIQWYPGHIAKAEKQLTKNLEKVDLVIEVRDARIPKATSHPHLDKWIKGKKHLLVINRVDMISSDSQALWNQWLQAQGKTPYWCNAKNGKGTNLILKAAVQAGEAVNERRRSRGMLNRPIRALALGFPNVGKSALINRLVGKKVVDSARRAGVTRSLRWVRMGRELDLLDAPGVLPPRLDDQEAALRLAICDDIGQGAYDVEVVAVAFLQMAFNISTKLNQLNHYEILETRYGVSYQGKNQDPYEWILAAANIHTSGDMNRMSQRVLDDFRKTYLGLMSIELPR